MKPGTVTDCPAGSPDMPENLAVRKGVAPSLLTQRSVILSLTK